MTTRRECFDDRQDNQHEIDSFANQNNSEPQPPLIHLTEHRSLTIETATTPPPGPVRIHLRADHFHNQNVYACCYVEAACMWQNVMVVKLCILFSICFLFFFFFFRVFVVVVAVSASLCLARSLALLTLPFIHSRFRVHIVKPFTNSEFILELTCNHSA